MEDLEIATRYVRKAESSRDRGIPFLLSFTSYKNLMRAKRCYYSGIKLTQKPIGEKGIRQTDRTLDRIDNSKGYEKGNVVACCHSVNKFKSYWEADNNIITTSIARKILAKLPE